MHKRNVLIVVRGLDIGGLEKVIAHICRFINKDKYEISVCCLHNIGVIGHELITEGCTVEVLPKLGHTKNNYISWFYLLSLIKAKDIHVLHSHSTDALLDVSICKLLKRNLRTMHTFHYGNYPNLQKKYLNLERICCRVVDQLVAVGNEQKDKIAKALNVRKESIRTVWNGVPISGEGEQKSVVDGYHKTGRAIIGTVCTLIEQKGLTYLIDVADILKKRGLNALFLIAGEGHLRQELESKVARYALDDNVVFMGWVENASQSFIPYIDVFFLPSLWEAMSVVVLEAMEAGKPVVVTDVGDNKYVIRDRVDGFIEAPGDIEAMADILIELIRNPEIGRRAGEIARKKVREEFSVAGMVEAYEQLYMME